ncbi:CDP-alcohol phosphatidyltransferase [Nitrospirillum viridazoti Y2]|uniref:CDP-alcohol phosphatidyltransferase-like enzyme n=1 Tax=Nitrospirillum amazonense TaxID=28077 RepID=A0A560HVE5_9PROT|nr:CDP-alcohol phosphatidyltransferase family protein [Nitrospirillum amazonense]EGX99698.1 CDP-alcohol phosphatidyltransferase [Nitrospirillum amazonense Y2]TWB50587.1 CDP-alcohol phosphatidyltransferase-like enzyme [Nitrospirillum amazonense]
MQITEPVKRTSEIEEVTNLYVIHPISSWLTPRFAALGIPPNAVSLAGMAFGIAAGVAYTHYQTLAWTVAAFVLMIAWHVMDGADGQLARLTNAQSETGKILDGICDYVTFIAVYVGLAMTLAAEQGGWVWIVIVAAGVAHAVQSAAYEMQRQCYNFWGWGRKSAELAKLDTPAAHRPGVLGALYRLYLHLQYLTTGVTVGFHDELARALAADEARAPKIREAYRAAFAPAVRRWSILSANYRTLGIFIAAAAGRPLLYFWFELVGFSVILAVLLSRQAARSARFLTSLRQAA